MKEKEEDAEGRVKDAEAEEKGMKNEEELEGEI